jgi:hypothetical protein
MAFITRVHGDAKPVFASDISNGSGSATTGVPVMLSGPKLDFFGIDLGANPATEMDPEEAIESVLRVITGVATVHFYQVEASGTANNMSVAVYQSSSCTASGLQASIRALGTVSGYDLSGATVTNVGFKLATA